MEKQRIATLTLDDGRSLELPILSGTLGPDVVDMRGLNKLGVFTYDPAFFATASCWSAGRQPAEPGIGSTSTAARSAPCSAISPCGFSVSL